MSLAIPAARPVHPADLVLRQRLQAGLPLQVGILLFTDVEVLDFAGPFEVFSVASRVARRDGLCAHAAFQVRTIAVDATPVRARHGLPVLPMQTFADAPDLDLLIVPGGVMDEPLASPAIQAWTRAAARQAPLVASVCTGAFLLARLGLLEGRRVTTHWEDQADLQRLHPGLEVVAGVPFVDLGGLLTSGGISAGIEMSLHLVARLLGPDPARAVARQMEYRWSPD
ncbi:DJ-1/PfpI family protein [Sphaerotilus hippei]|uniref:DJ-1/PfpI family protein n=1 Tax=Sphaerotilus hippei TaxID=744406 RepID=A0A318GUL9_9BURK|nr:DJ-1/PfpI family protein [Sphaerotilus hippei]PXW92417.1 DJ-1/PfpI family protein [Sphaerotilus hippei]